MSRPATGGPRTARRPLPSVVACAVLLFVVGAGPGAHAQDSYGAPVLGVSLAEGPRWGWGSSSAATLGGVGLFAGWRADLVRVGALGQVAWWDGSHGPVVDFGGFVSLDFASAWIDPQLSAAAFARIEPAVRWESDAAVWALAPSLVVGGRALGFEIGFAATWERWLSEVPGGDSKDGVGAQLRIGFDLVEITRLAHHACAGSTPQPP
jgi:hypothetical protein